MRSLGLDVSARRGQHFVLLDGARRVLAQGRLPGPEDLREALGRLAPHVVAIDSPPSFATKAALRGAERRLLDLGIRSFTTPGDPERQRGRFYDWMRAGHRVFAAAARAGYPLYDGRGAVRHRALEVFPHATAVALRGSLPPAGCARRASCKARWRRRVLEDQGVDTRALSSPDLVDAALAALTGLLALGGTAVSVGDPEEGVIVVPGPLPDRPFPREAAPDPRRRGWELPPETR